MATQMGGKDFVAKQLEFINKILYCCHIFQYVSQPTLGLRYDTFSNWFITHTNYWIRNDELLTYIGTIHNYPISYLLYAIGYSKNCPRHHSKSAICKNFNVKVFTNSRIEFHTLQKGNKILRILKISPRPSL